VVDCGNGILIVPNDGVIDVHKTVQIFLMVQEKDQQNEGRLAKGTPVGEFESRAIGQQGELDGVVADRPAPGGRGEGCANANGWMAGRENNLFVWPSSKMTSSSLSLFGRFTNYG
jgi:hypothetical protein